MPQDPQHPRQAEIGPDESGVSIPALGAHQGGGPAARSVAQIMFDEAKLLIVDDERANVRLLEIILQQAGYRNVYGSTDPRQTVSLCRGIAPDLLLLDLSMPGMDGFAVMDALRTELPGASIPVLVLTADVRPAAKHRALGEGALDFLTKPFDDVEVLLRIRNLLSSHFHSVILEETVQDRTRDLERAQLETLQRLALAAEYRDDATGMHTRRVGKMSGHIAEEMGLSAKEAARIAVAAPLHDVGKIAVPDSILLKPGKLTAEEFEQIKQHTVIGARILSGSVSPLLKVAGEIAMYHHERWDGSGYLGLVGEEIPLAGRIVCVADVFDALTHVRPYKRAWSPDEARTEILAQRGQQFDPDVVDAFLRATSHSQTDVAGKPASCRPADGEA